MNNLGIRKKLVLMFSGICSLFGISLVIILLFTMNQANETKILKDEVSRRATILKERGDLFQAQVSGLQGYLLSQDKKQLEKFNQAGEQLAATREQVTKDKHLSGEIKETVLMGKEWRAIIDEKVIPLTEEGNWEEASKIALENSELVETALQNFAMFAKNEDKKRDTLIASLEQTSDIIQYAVFLSLVICSMLSIVLALSFSNKLVKPIHEMNDKLKELASQEGDLTARLTIHSKDELGDIATSFNHMLDNLQHIIGRVQTVSEEVREASLQVAAGMNSSMNETTYIQQTMGALESNIIAQVSSIEESSTAMDDMTTGVQRIAESASTVASLAGTTSEKADIGNKVIEKSISQMTAIHEAVNETSQVVDRLITHTEHIDTALQSISHIAEQTNLLALNASIEAARAGEQGRGFAVVADEVRKLAEQSKEAATDINQLLRHIQDETKTANVMMTKGQSESAEGIAIIREAGSSFTTITEHVHNVSTQIQEVSATAEEMAASAEEMNTSLNNISFISNEVAAETTKTSHSAEGQVTMMKDMSVMATKMKNVIEELNTLVSHFKI
ncbi:chemotaxis protein [Bacillus manliponensis]|uniref:Chemotaxis protein n=1 Tax=Bacillus manliponensis TaxID=574376 RepID=A0A073K1K8_9BACI|nr:methyl-accepting chemotaxis protein [Bacillus manliponensis]KEK21219.1 chemotaxis protein [Bacillus manliponensis]